MQIKRRDTNNAMLHTRLDEVQMATQSDSGFVADDLRDAAQSAGQQDEYMSKQGWG